MSNSLNKPSVRKQTANAFARLEELEVRVNHQQESLVQIVGAINKVLAKQEESQKDILRQLDAVIGLLGVDTVVAAMKANQEAEIAANAVAQKEEILQRVGQGQLVPAEAITEATLFTGVEYLPDGTPVHPGYACLYIKKLANETDRAGLLGKKVGEEYITTGGNKFVVQEIFSHAAKPEATEAAPTPTAETPAEAVSAEAQS